MYKDIITYQLADGISEEHLFSTANKIAADWMRHQAGFIKWQIHANADGSYTDIVQWNSLEDAKRAEQEMSKMPHALEWFGCYKEGSISSKSVTLLREF